ncbi:phage tail sheath family protein [Psychroserpens algicola]|uniref:Phage tail sheath subtilisin-like domain-containing protein n=1 Tax=Psychroserpens algicola TaxID=1719034 RepID=A0ABT0H7Y5_9FLAO|nr:phage tail sheath C-terminal domain-containing protein [Psychroserpens algicola]MCK8480159.1 phage tail sheath subtilisin-like domain-containing protein [Psychroserpens algicola]
MNENKMKTPGVYIEEINAFGNSVVPVPTAVPAFVGYTPQAKYEGVSYINVAKKISSFAEFQSIYCYPDSVPPEQPVKQYNPDYYLVKQDQQPVKGDFITIEGSLYAIVPDPNTIYYLYNSIRLFFLNGGGDAYVVSVGTYGDPSGNPSNPEDHVINPNVELNDLLAGIKLLENEAEPTMYICPEATLLSVENNATLMQSMLLQNAEMKSAISIFDVIGGRQPDPFFYTKDISTFRNNTGVEGLSYGCAYYPFIGTTIMQDTDIDFTNLFGGNIDALAVLLKSESLSNPNITSIIKAIKDSSTIHSNISQLHTALLNASRIYHDIIAKVLSVINVLPPSGGMAGVITVTDNEIGPWQSPANRSVVGAVSLPIRLTEAEQAGLNVDAISGKSINAIRFFNGVGILIWGARTLDGNSNDWRYISVRRTLIFIEQSSILAARAYVFEPNDANTWKSVKALLSSFLTSIWKEGGLQGAMASDAFSVQCGLGTTMTSEDVLNGLMKVSIKVAVVRPAEFIVITFEQQMTTTN